MRIDSNPKPSDVENFIKNCEDSLKTFKYFEKRPYQIIDKHILTIILYDLGQTVGYGHLEKENNVIWLGIVVNGKNKSKGYGKQLMKYLIDFYLKKLVDPLFLTVHIKNKHAQSLFKNFGFFIYTKINHKSYLMKFNKTGFNPQI